MKKTSTGIGQEAETAVCRYMTKQGYTVIDRNWRTRYCEIDIVARRQSTVYFVEVKYRKDDNQGSGFDYVTPRKLKQMSFAAEFWLAKNDSRDDGQLMAAEVTGPTFRQISLVEI